VGAFTAADQAGNYSNNSILSSHHDEFHAVMPNVMIILHQLGLSDDEGILCHTLTHSQHIG